MSLNYLTDHDVIPGETGQHAYTVNGRRYPSVKTSALEVYVHLVLKESQTINDHACCVEKNNACIWLRTRRVNLLVTVRKVNAKL